MSTESKIWVLGSHNSNADRNIWWNESFQNLSDPDIIIINLPTLNSYELLLINKEKFVNAQSAIMDKFFHKGLVIVVTAPRIEVKDSGKIYFNYDLSPIDVKTIDVPEGQVIKFDQQNQFSSYLQDVRSFNFYLTDFVRRKVYLRIPDEIHPHVNVTTYNMAKCTDNSGHILGDQFTIFLTDNYGNIQRKYGDAGELIFLPSIKDRNDETINKILQILGRTSTRKEEPFPEWANKITLPQLKEKEMEFSKLNAEKQNIAIKIEQAIKEKQELVNHIRLLYSNGTSLEEAVFNAFKLLGFDNIKKIRETELEDWVFEFNNVTDFAYGVIEVKGSENRTSLANLTQCNKWVEDYLLENKKGKGIFVTNQYRLEEYPNSRQKKLHFEPNELDYARTRQICIIPSCVLFEAVNMALDGKAKSRKELEKLIAETNGVLNEL